MIWLGIHLYVDESTSDMNSGSEALRAHGFTLHQRRVSRIHPTITEYV